MSDVVRTRLIQGPPGPASTIVGPSGPAGVGNTALTASFAMPVVSASSTAQVTTTAAMAPGQVLYVQTIGYLQVVSVTDGTHVVLENLGYPGNAAPSIPASSGSLVVPGGLQGPAGVAGPAGPSGPQGPTGPGGATGLPDASSLADGDYMLDVAASGATKTWKALNADTLPAGFAVSLAVVGGPQTFEVGHSFTPTYTPNPATDAAGVSNPLFHDNQAHGDATIGGGSTIAPGYTYALANPGPVVGTYTATKGGITKSGAATAGTYQDRGYIGLSATNAPTGSTVNGTNCDLVGATGTLTGALGSFGSGHVFPQVTGAGGGSYVIIKVRHTATALTFTDNESLQSLPMSRVATNVTFTNREGLVMDGTTVNGEDIYVSTQKLGAGLTVTPKVN